MAWLAKLNVQSHRWPWPFRWAYVAMKWYLAAIGAFALIMWWLHTLGLPSLWMD